MYMHMYMYMYVAQVKQGVVWEQNTLYMNVI